MARGEDPGLCLLGSMAILKQVSELRASSKAAQRMEVEGVHQTRVASRRLRAALPIFSSCFKESQRDRWRNSVKDLTRSLGEARDADVQIGFLRELMSRVGEAERTGVRALLDLKERARVDLQEQVARWLESVEEEGVLKDMERLLGKRVRRLEARKADVRGRPSYAAGLAHVSRRTNRVLELEPFINDPGAIGKHHDLRIAVKRLRYTLEAFRPLFDDQLKKEIGALKMVQDLLGEMHDCDVWLDSLSTLEEEMRSLPGVDIEAVLPGLRALADDRDRERGELYRRFTAQWASLRGSKFFESLAGRFRSGMTSGNYAIPPEDSGQPPKLGIVSDIHGNMGALEAVMEDARSRGVSWFISLGDMVGSGPYPEEVVRSVRDERFLSVVGNFDLKVLKFARRPKRPGPPSVQRSVLAAAARDLSEDSLKFIASLPPEIRLEVGGHRLLLVHASPDGPDEHLDPDTPEERLAELSRISDADIVMVGHSHRSFVRTVNGTMFINPGSVGRPVDGDPRASYAILDIASLSASLHRVDYDVEAALRALREKGLPEEVVEVVQKSRSAGEVGLKMAPPLDRKAAMAWIERAARQMNVDHRHAETVLRTATALFRQLTALHGLGCKDLFLLEAACLLHDVGISEGVKGHHRSSYRLIMEADLPLPPRDRSMVALMARFHRKRPPEDSDEQVALISGNDRRRLYSLTSILRIADGLDHQHAGLVKDVGCSISDDEVVIKISSDGDWSPESEAALRKSDLFERTFRRRVRFE